MTRADIRTRVRDYLYEAAADRIDNNQLNRLYEEETRSLPGKGVYLSEVWEATLTDEQNITLPTGAWGISRVEKNYASASDPDWQDISYWSSYGDTLRFDDPITATIRASLNKSFTVVSNDTDSLDISDAKSEVLVWGIVIRAYKMLIGYLTSSKSWDSVTKPGDLSIPVLQNWLRDAKIEYRELLKQYQVSPSVRSMNLTS